MGTLSLKTLEVLGRGGLPSHVVAETWVVSDVDGEQGIIRNGPLAGATLRDLIRDHPVELMGEGWSGNHSPPLTTFIDASGMLPVHLHANDDARTLEGEANGKTETWHILEAAPGATALCGVRQGVSREESRDALERQDDAVLRRLPVVPGRRSMCPAVRRTVPGRTRWSTRSGSPPTPSSTRCHGAWRTDR